MAKRPSLEQLNTPKSNEKRMSEASLKDLIESDTFRKVYRDFFVFCQNGDYLKGIILSKHDNRHIRRSNSYRIKVLEGRQAGVDFRKPQREERIEEFFANMRTQRIIDENELIGSVVRIVLIGTQDVYSRGHGPFPAKVYDILKDKGTKEILQNETKPKKPRTARKSRGRTQ